MQETQNKNAPNSTDSNLPADNQMAQNPNPRANENTQAAPFDKDKPGDGNASDVGSEITDGAAS